MRRNLENSNMIAQVNIIVKGYVIDVITNEENHIERNNEQGEYFSRENRSL